MKCVCGYAHARDQSQLEYYQSLDKYKGARFGKDQFIEVNGHFTVDSGGWHKGQREAYLYACPECDTIQLSC